MSAGADTRETYVPERPDLAWIRENVPVLDVGQELGLLIKKGWTQCWRTENHANGDADPSLHFYQRRNRVRCFVCDPLRGMSNIDLVMGVLGVDCAGAAEWIAQRFSVPETRPGRPKGARSKPSAPYRVGVNGSEFEVLVLSGLWGQLTPAERSILPVLHIFRDPESGLTRISYGAIMRYAGVGKRANVSNALRRLERIHAIETSRGSRFGITRDVNAYRVTLESEKLRQLCTETYRQGRPEVERERAERREARLARENEAIARRRTLSPPVPVTLEGAPPPAPLVSFSSSEGDGLRPNPPHNYPNPTATTCAGLNLSSPRELSRNLSVPIGNLEITEAEHQRRIQDQKARLDDWMAEHSVSEVA